MTITQLDPADSVALDRWYDLRVVVTRHDLPDFPTPSRIEHSAQFEHPLPGSSEEALLAWDGDRVVGAAGYRLPQNVSVVYLGLIVDPQYRRRGIGTRLLAEVYAAARRHDRSLIEIETVRALPGGIARDEAGYRYLTKRGHQPGVTSVRSRCQVAETLAEAWTPADGYSLVQWRDVAPEEIVEDVAALQSRLMLDAPSGDLVVEQQLYDAARVRGQEATPSSSRPTEAGASA